MSIETLAGLTVAVSSISEAILARAGFAVKNFLHIFHKTLFSQQFFKLFAASSAPFASSKGKGGHAQAQPPHQSASQCVSNTLLAHTAFRPESPGTNTTLAPRAAQ